MVECDFWAVDTDSSHGKEEKQMEGSKTRVVAGMALRQL